jgi:hypothetical protein
MALPVTLTERKYETDVLKYEALNDYARETIIVKAANGVLDVGTVLGLEASTGKYSVNTVPGTANGGIETPRAVLLRKIDATSVDVVTVVAKRGPAKVASNALIWGASYTTPTLIAAGVAALEATTGIIARRAA